MPLALEQNQQEREKSQQQQHDENSDDDMITTLRHAVNRGDVKTVREWLAVTHHPSFHSDNQNDNDNDNEKKNRAKDFELAQAIFQYAVTSPIAAESATMEIMELLVQAHPRVLQGRIGSEAATVLHTAVSHAQCRFQIVSYLIRQAPYLVQTLDAQGKTVLHWLCQGSRLTRTTTNNDDDNNSSHIISNNNSSNNNNNNDGSKSSHASLAITRAVWEAWPQALLIRDTTGALPLHYSYITKAPASQVRFLASKEPSALSVPMPSDERCLCQALADDYHNLVSSPEQDCNQCEALVDLLEALIAMNPSVLYTHHPRTGLSLVQVAQRNISNNSNSSSSNTTLRLDSIIQQYQVRGKTMTGESPKASPKTSTKSVEGYTTFTKTRTTTATTTMTLAEATVQRILACLTDHSADSTPPAMLAAQIQTYLQKCPEAAQFKDAHGQVLFHMVCSAPTSNQHITPHVLQVLLQAWPQAIREPIQNWQRFLPLHLACYYYGSTSCGLSLPCIQWLIQQYPAALEQYASDGCLPIHHACVNARGGATAALVHCLAKAAPHTVRQRTQPQPAHHPSGHLDHGGHNHPNKGKLPLHLVCQAQYADMQEQLDIMAGLLMVWPESLYQPDGTADQCLPIHYLCQGGSSVLVEYMLMQDPAFLHLKAKDAAGNLPLHALCANPKATLEFIQEIVEACPQAVLEANLAGQLPADLAESINMDIAHFLDEIAESVIGDVDAVHASSTAAATSANAHASGITHWVRRRERQRSCTATPSWSPLHQACRHDSVTVADLRTILTERPEDIYQADDAEGMLPLHIALRAGAPLEVIEYLIQEWSDALQWMNHGGSLPLHTACSNPCTSAEVIRALITAWPKAARVANHYGWLPLHAACAHGASSEVINVLVRAHVHATKMATYQEQDLPLHLACGSLCPSLEVIYWLIDGSPEPTVLGQANALGELPLHKAVIGCAPLEIIQFLVEQHPRSIQVPNGQGDTPLDLAKLCHVQHHGHDSYRSSSILAWMEQKCA